MPPVRHGSSVGRLRPAPAVGRTSGPLDSRERAPLMRRKAVGCLCLHRLHSGCLFSAHLFITCCRSAPRRCPVPGSRALGGSSGPRINDGSGQSVQQRPENDSLTPETARAHEVFRLRIKCVFVCRQRTDTAGIFSS